jgi:hypothetical protein
MDILNPDSLIANQKCYHFGDLREAATPSIASVQLNIPVNGFGRERLREAAFG